MEGSPLVMLATAGSGILRRHARGPRHCETQDQHYDFSLAIPEIDAHDPPVVARCPHVDLSKDLSAPGTALTVDF